MKKSQSAMEFVILASFMLVLIVSLFGVITSKLFEAREEVDKNTAKDIAEYAFNEIEIAFGVNNGYSRIFNMPPTINGINYTIVILNNRELVVNYSGFGYIKFLPTNVSGVISKGANRITKQNNNISLNTVTPECSNGVDDDGDVYYDNSDPGCYLMCNYLSPSNYNSDRFEVDNCRCTDLPGAVCCLGLGTGTHFTPMDYRGCPGQCWSTCLGVPVYTIKNGNQKVASFLDSGDLVLRGTITSGSVPVQTADDEFVYTDPSGNNVAVINAITGNLFISGGFGENIPSPLLPAQASEDFIIQNSNGDVVAYIEQNGNLRLHGRIYRNNGTSLD